MGRHRYHPDADGGDGVWNTTNTNWDTAATGGSDTTFGTGNQAVFGGTAGTVTLEADITSGTITGTGGSPNGALNFATVGYLITGGGTLRTITTSGAIQINGNPATFDTDVNFALGGALILSNCGTSAINGVISGAQGIVKGGGGTYTLGANNSYTGVTTINQGVLVASSIKNVGGGDSSLGAPSDAPNGRIGLGLGSGALTATMRYTGGTQSTDCGFYLSGSAGGTGGIDMSGTGTLTITGALTAAGGAKTLTHSGSTEGIGEFQGAIGGTGTNATSVVKNGSGTWVLSNAAIPEPSAALLGAIGLLALLRRRRR